MAQHSRLQVFLVHSSDDSRLLEQHVINVLEPHVRCIYDGNFAPGTYTVTNIRIAITSCHKTIVFLTSESQHKPWVKYETLLALEKSQKEKQLHVIIVCFDIPHVSEQFFGVLSNAMTVKVDTSLQNWKSRYKEELFKKISEEVPVNDVLVMANLSVGQAWSHFTGYSSVVLPVLKSTIQQTDLYYHNEDRYPTVEFNLIPTSGIVVKSLEKLDSRIKAYGMLPKIYKGRGSFRERFYQPSIYTISDSDGKVYFFVGSTPNSLSILGKLERQEFSLNESAPMTMSITAGERSLQVSRFYITFNRLVNHPENTFCNNRARLILYNDTDNVGDILLSAIKTELRNRRKDCLHMETQPSCNFGRAGGQNRSEYQMSVFIDCTSCTKDRQTCAEIKAYLEERNFRVHEAVMPGCQTIRGLENTMSKCKWAVIIISDMSKSNEYCDEMNILQLHFRSILHDCVMKNEARVIPILDGVNEKSVPTDISAVTYLSKQEPNYLEKLLRHMCYASIPMDSAVSATNVHQGLAWAYVINYLDIVLDDHINKLREIQRDIPHQNVYMKMFILVPGSCANKPLSSLDKDENGFLRDTRFRQREEIHYESKTVAGTISRKYQLMTYEVVKDRKINIVALEYPNPLLCLAEMAEREKVSGLKHEEVFNEAWSFKELVQKIIDYSNLKNKAKLVYYDDTKITLVDALIQMLEDEDS